MPVSTNRDIENFWSVINGEPLALTENVALVVREVLQQRLNGQCFTDEEIAQRLEGHAVQDTPVVQNLEFGQLEGAGPRIVNGVAILPMQGIMAPRMNLIMRYSGGTSTQEFAKWFRQADQNSDVKAIVFDVNSPGGTAEGNQELVDAIREVNSSKPVTAVVTGVCASAAYYVASAAKEMVATPSSKIGSIGTLALHQDVSAQLEKEGRKVTVIRAGQFKAVPNSYEPLDDKSRQVAQESVDKLNEMFVSAVAENRGVSVETVQKKFGQGKTVLAAEAVQLGMIDRVGTLGQVVQELSGSPSGGPTTQQKGSVMNKQVMAAMISMGLIEEGTGEQTAQTLLQMLCAQHGLPSVPQDTQQILQFLEQHKPAATPAAAPAVDPAVPGQNVPPQQPMYVGWGMQQYPGQPMMVPPYQPQNPGQPEQNGQPGQQGQNQPPQGFPFPGPGYNPMQYFPPMGGNQQVQNNQLQRQAVEAERSRVQELRARGQALQISDEQIDQAIDTGMTLEQAADQWTAELAKQNRPLAAVTQDSEDKFEQAALTAMCLQVGVSMSPEEAKQAGGLQNRRVVDLCKQSLQMRGVRMFPDTDEDIIKQAMKGAAGEEMELIEGTLQMGGNSRPGDFPNLLGSVMRRMLDNLEDYSETTYRKWAHKMADVEDFSPKTLVKTGEFPELAMIQDGEEPEEGKIGEEVSFIQADRFGRKWKITPYMMAQNNLQDFRDLFEDNMEAADQTLNRLLIELLTGDFALVDGFPLFDDTNHKNYRAAGAAPSTDELQQLNHRLRKQVGVDELRTLGYRLSTILHPTDLDLDMVKVLRSDLRVETSTEKNPDVFRGQVQHISEPMLDQYSSTAYYGFANIRRARPIVYAKMRGYKQPRIKSYWENGTECRIFKIEDRFGGAVRNFRGVTKNNGTGA